LLVSGVQGVPTKITPPAVTVGAERGGVVFVYAKESGPKTAFHEIFGEPHPEIATRPGGSSVPVAEATVA
jgi:hypothetical protein